MTEAEFAACAPDHRVILAVIALEFHPPRAEHIAATLTRSGLLPEGSTAWSESGIKRALATLQGEGKVGRDPSGAWFLNPLDRPLVLAEQRRLAPEPLGRLAARMAAQSYRYDSGLSHLIHHLFLAVVAEDKKVLDRATAAFDEWLAPRTEREVEPLTPWGQTLVGFVLKHAQVTGAWLQFPPAHRSWFVGARAYGAIQYGVPARDLPEKLRAGETDPAVLALLGDWEVCGALVEGEPERAFALAAGGTTPTMVGARILVRYLEGDESGALELLDAWREPAFVPGPLFPLLGALALARGRAPVTKIKSWAEEHEPTYGETAKILWAGLRHRGKADAAELTSTDLLKVEAHTALDRLLAHCVAAWNGIALGRVVADNHSLELKALFAVQGARWYEAEEALVLERLLADPRPQAAALAALRESTGVRRFLFQLVDADTAWESSLKRLADLKFDAPGGVAKKEKAETLVWMIDPVRAEVRPALRRLLKGGQWSVPKTAPVIRLAKGDHPAITPEDRPVLKALSQGYYGWDWDHKKALEALAGHPRLFLATQPDTPLILEAEEVELRVEEKDGQLKFQFSSPLDGPRARLVKVAADHWRVPLVTDKLRKVAEVVGPGLTVPAEGRQRVVEVLARLAAGIQVRSPLLKESRTAVDLVADPRPVVLLQPRGEGVVVEVHVRPLGPGTPLLRPGEGPALVHATVGDRLLTGTRDAQAERRAWKAVLERCPDLDAGLGGGWTLDLEEPLDVLAVLAELRDASDAVATEWPQGGRIGLHPKVGVRSLRLSLTADHQWFEVSGQVAVDADRVVAFQELIAGGAPTRFLRLADGDWIELEGQLLRQLEHLAAVAEPAGQGLHIAPWALASSELLLDETVSRAADEAERWRRRWKLGVSPNLGLPSSLSVELRPYQREGFRWLARLAEVGAGACLADDMGLGKTAQTIALLAHRASEGPSLVVAPTSVAPHWAAEIRRFDRHLEPFLLGEGSRADRASLVGSLTSGQVLLVTYGLLVTESELLATVAWNVVVLDEAQAVKNALAKRTRAALNLRAAFRLAVTGTPLQNHLGELWTLFEFLNPGLLGSRTRFTRRFWTPIEAQNDEGARQALQALVRPFLLRRTKNQVLTELPEKTETVLAVDLAPDERAWYEAVRRTALERMAEAETRPGERQILMLTHLMKLRRACCHPVLAGGPEAPSSSKLDLLELLLEELMDNDHRVLVFSQFTDHLALIEARVRARGWDYEYLDGSTPSRERSERVARFQTGSAPVFLISLQAGGTGLNLTAADYVVHMDPWWNPAVEDQASDRVHRLGQTRPVTIYRLVARDTIEERIVALHRTKRDLADALLEGAEAAARLGPEELMALIAGVPPERP